MDEALRLEDTKQKVLETRAMLDRIVIDEQGLALREAVISKVHKSSQCILIESEA